MLSALRTSRLYNREVFLVITYVRVWVDPRAIENQEGLIKGILKNLMTISGIETRTSGHLIRRRLKVG